jgi:predicted nucleic acid-binding protein
MSVRSFFDTNVLVYTDDRSAPAKQQAALDLFEEHLRAGTGVLSLQVLQEYFATSRKLRVDPALARQKVELFATLDMVVPALDDLLAAIDLHRLHDLSIWDALVVRAAQRSGCAVLLTEDLQHGRSFDGVQVENPFLSVAER